MINNIDYKIGKLKELAEKSKLDFRILIIAPEEKCGDIIKRIGIIYEEIDINYCFKCNYIKEKSDFEKKGCNIYFADSYSVIQEELDQEESDNGIKNIHFDLIIAYDFNGSLIDFIMKNELYKVSENKRKINLKAPIGIGPIKKYWIVPIVNSLSDFNNKLFEKGLTYDENSLYFSNPCQIDDFKMFRFNMISLIYRQTHDVIYLKGHPNIENEIITAIDLLDAIFSNGQNSNDVKTYTDNITVNAQKYFNATINLKLDYKTFSDIYTQEKTVRKRIDENQIKEGLRDYIDFKIKIQGSLLIDSLFYDLKYYGDAFWEHVLNMIYIAAYGTLRQWQQFMDEYIFVSHYFNKIIREDKEKKAKILKLKEKIEEYIVNWSSQI